MSGLCGTVRSAAGLDRMGAQLTYRDESAETLNDGPVAFGAVGLPGAICEFRDAVGVRIVAQARLDEPEAVARDLGIASGAAAAELLLGAYLRWGLETPARVAGAYAFALWDARTATLVLARDHIGLVPLYFSVLGEEVIFASTAEAVLASGRVSSAPDELALIARATNAPQFARSRSLFAAIKRVAPASLVTIRPGSAPRVVQYWNAADVTPMASRRTEEYVELLSDEIAAAVTRAVRGPGVFGAHISGGLDSSACAVLAGRELSRRGERLIRGYSWSPSSSAVPVGNDERTAVHALASLIGLPIEFTDIGASNVDTALARDLALAPNSDLLYELSVLASAERHGISVLLSGTGGDETVSFQAAGHLAHLLRHGRLREAFAEARAPVGDRRAPARNVYSALWHLWHLGLMPMFWELPGARHRLSAHQRRLIAEGSRLHPSFETFVRESKKWERSGIDPHRRRAEWLHAGFLSERLNTWAILGAQHGVEYRYPLLDRHLLETCLAMPIALWRHDGIGRWVFRAAVEPILPPAIVWGTKDDPSRLHALETAYRHANPPSVASRSNRVAAHVAVNHRDVHREIRAIGLAGDLSTPRRRSRRPRRPRRSSGPQA